MIICEDIFAIFIYTDIAMMLKLQYSFNKWDSSNVSLNITLSFFYGKKDLAHFSTILFDLLSLS